MYGPGPHPRGPGGAPASRHQLRPFPPGGRRGGAGQRRARSGGRHRHRARRRRPFPGAGGQYPGPLGGVVRDRKPSHHDPRVSGAVPQPLRPSRRWLSRQSARSVASRCAGKCPGVRRWWCLRRGCTTRPISSTPSWPARWGSSWWRGATSPAAKTWSTCGRPKVSGGWTSCIGGSTTSSSTRSTSGRTQWWAARASSTRLGRERHLGQRSR